MGACQKTAARRIPTASPTPATSKRQGQPRSSRPKRRLPAKTRTRPPLVRGRGVSDILRGICLRNRRIPRPVCRVLCGEAVALYNGWVRFRPSGPSDKSWSWRRCFFSSSRWGLAGSRGCWWKRRCLPWPFSQAAACENRYLERKRFLPDARVRPQSGFFFLKFRTSSRERLVSGMLRHGLSQIVFDRQIRA